MTLVDFVAVTVVDNTVNMFVTVAVVTAAAVAADVAVAAVSVDYVVAVSVDDFIVVVVAAATDDNAVTVDHAG